MESPIHQSQPTNGMLYYNTVNPLLRNALEQIMQAEIFNDFRLVGGTSLSLQLGHRISVDLDIFTDASYGSVDFEAIDQFLADKFDYLSHSRVLPAMGKSYFVGTDSEHTVKLDVYYTDPFIRPALVIDGIRLATIDEIVAMKMDVIQRTGRKKDFWDIHEIMDIYSLDQMLALHQERYPHSHDEDLIKKNLTDFNNADDDFEPVCLRGKHWELIKYDLFKTFGNSSNSA